jgi:hypothetical protein
MALAVPLSRFTPRVGGGSVSASLRRDESAFYVRFNMGLFSKAPKSNPKIIVEGIEIVFYRQTGHDIWEFKYRGIEFFSPKPVFAFPTKAGLDDILNALDSLKAEMRSRLKKSLKLDDGESYMVDVQDFAAERSFEVSWSGGASWGDMGVDFTIRDGAILSENWGD